MQVFNLSFHLFVYHTLFFQKVISLYSSSIKDLATSSVHSDSTLVINDSRYKSSSSSSHQIMNGEPA